MDCEGESPSNERDVMESVVNSLIEDSDQNIDLDRVGKCSYISCSYMFLYYIRKIFVEAKMFLYFLIFFH